MKQKLSLLLSLGYCTLSQGIFLNSATAQVAPDGTTNTTVDVSGNDFTINQGNSAGSNLFHSFGEFSVPNGGSAFFNAGNIFINASDSVEILRTPEGIFLQTGIYPNSLGSTGDSGNITVNTSRLIVRDGAGIANVSGGIFGGMVFSREGGVAGNVNINATELVEISGISEPLADGTRIGSFLSGQTTTEQSGGQLTINTEKLIIQDGGLITASTLDAGDAGALTINASESIEITGTALNGQFPSKIEASSGRAFSIEDTSASGNAGDLNITTGNLTVRDGGLITASTLGEGAGGNINIDVFDSLTLENEASIAAETTVTEGGNLNLEVGEILSLSDQSLISAQAFNQANGGNINIDTDFIIAFPNQNNDIIANAQQGQGGKIDITAEALFGIAERPLNEVTNDINASSEFGLDGTVSIVTPDINPIQTDIQLPNDVVETETLGTNACSGRGATEGASFIVKGKGGIPPKPTEPFDSETILVDEAIIAPNLQAQYPGIKPIKTSMGDIYPARGIIKTSDGKIILTAYATDNINTRTPHNFANCSL